MIYLDYSAHTPPDDAVLQRFIDTENRFIGNANSRHAAGEAARAEMQRITEAIAQNLGVQPSEIICTSGASESNNLAIKGIARASRHIGRHIISTPLEHSSVSGCLTALQEQGYEIDLLEIQSDGTVSIENLKELIRNDTVLVAICAVDSELGAVQPISKIAEVLQAYPDCRFHVDATQATGKAKMDWRGVDTASLSGHKFYGLCGSGLLLKRTDCVLEPLIHGGASTTIYRSGTPALGLAASLDEALSLTMRHMDERVDKVAQSNAFLREALSKYKKVRINSPQNAVPHILNLSVEGVKGRDFQKALDRHGVCVSVKSACSVENTPSRAVFAVSRSRKNALSSWRISLSHLTTREELQAFLAAFESCLEELKC